MVVDAVQGNEKQCSLVNRPDVHTWYIAFRVKPWIYTYLFTRIFYVFVCNHIDNLFNVETHLADKLTANNKKKIASMIPPWVSDKLRLEQDNFEKKNGMSIISS